MRLEYWLLIVGVVTLALTGCIREPAAPSPTSTFVPGLSLPVLAGTPVPMPNEPITPDNVDRIRELAVWGKGRISQVAYSPNGELMAVGTTAGIWIYEAKTLNLLRFIETEQWVRGLIFAPDSLTLKTLLDITTIATWDVSTGQRLNTQTLEPIIGQNHPLGNTPRVRFSADGTKVAIFIPAWIFTNSRVGVWDTGSGELLSSPDKLTHGGHFRDLALSLDGNLLALTFQENSSHKDIIWLWDVRQGVILQTEPASNEGFLAFSPDGKLLSKGRQVWEAEGLTPGCTQEEDIIAGGIAFSPDGLLLAAGVRGGNIKVWEAATCRLHQNFVGHRTAVSGLVFSPDGGRLVSWSRDGALQQWDSETGALLNTLEGHWPAIRDMAITPDSSTIFISPGFNFGTLDSFDREIYLQDIKTGQRTGVLTGGHITDAAMALSADGKTLVSSEDFFKYAGKTTLVWDVESGQVRRDIGGPRGGKIALSPDGGKLAVTGLDSKNRCVGVSASQTNEGLYGACGGRGVEMAFSPDGTKLVLVGDGAAHIFDADTGDQLAALENSGYLVGTPGFSPDGQTVATSTTEGIALWRLNDPQIIHRWQVVTDAPSINEPPDYNSTRHLVAFSPDGRLLASGVSELAAPQLVIQPALRFWDARQGTALYTVPGYASNLSRLFFSPDGKLLITASLDGTIRLWGIPPQ